MHASSAAGSRANTADALLSSQPKILRIAEEPELGGLDVAGAELARRQGGQRVDVGEHEARLVEGADEVLALGRIDAGLAADRGVDLRQQRGRHLHEAHAASHDACGEAGEIADNAAAERDHEIAALEAHLEQPLRQPRQHRKALGPLAGRHHLRLGAKAGGSQAGLEARELAGGCHVGIRDDAAPDAAQPTSR